MRLVLVLLITISSYNIIHHHYNIDITDILPQLKADVQIEASTAMKLENPKNDESQYILTGDKISIKTTLDFFENYIFEYYDHPNGVLYISLNQKTMYAPLNKIKWIKIVDYRRHEAIFPTIARIVTGAAIGAGIGFGAGTVSCVGVCMNDNDCGTGVIALPVIGTGVGAIIGTLPGVAALIEKGGNYTKKGKIHLTGKKAWEISPVDADEIIQSYINTANPIY